MLSIMREVSAMLAITNDASKNTRYQQRHIIMAMIYDASNNIQ